MGAPAGPGKGGASSAAETPMPPVKPVMDDALLEANMGEADLRNKLVTEAYGTMLPQRRNPDEYEK
jgi:hypothetical protein